MYKYLFVLYQLHSAKFSRPQKRSCIFKTARADFFSFKIQAIFDEKKQSIFFSIDNNII